MSGRLVHCRLLIKSFQVRFLTLPSGTSLMENYSMVCTDWMFFSVYLEFIYYFTYFSPSPYPSVVCFFPVGRSLLIQHFQHVLWVLSTPTTPTRPVENFVLTTKGKKHTTDGWDDAEK